MVKLVWLGVILAVVWVWPAVAEEMTIHNHTIIYLYESRVEERATKDEIAKMISTVYREASDEFIRREYMQELSPIIEKNLADALGADKVVTTVSAILDEYDFEREGFPTHLGKDSFVPYGDYALGFGNGEVLGFFPLELETARRLSGKLPRSRRVRFVLHGVVGGVGQEWFEYWNRNTGRDVRERRKAVYMEIERVGLELYETDERVGVFEVR